MNELITLYIKTHNITGLKYFGKTKSKDPHKYKGSGVYWTNHINKHGYNVTTEILGQFTDIVECKKVAILFSKNNNIVESKGWANLKEESLDGGWDYINDNGLNLFSNLSEEAKIKYVNGSRKGGITSGNLAKLNGTGIFGLTTEQRITNRVLAQEAVFEKYGVISIFSILNKDEAFQEKRKEAFKNIQHQQGEKNSQFGKMWITNGIDSTRILKNSSIPEDWRKGRVIKV